MTSVTIAFPKRTQEKETSLLMHYLDVVFPTQFPMHEKHYEGRREWLLTILTSSRSVYYATLSLSLLHKESHLDDLKSIWQSERRRYYILALQESQKLLGQLDSVSGIAKLKGNIHALASAVQLISIEVNNFWNFHFPLLLLSSMGAWAILETNRERFKPSSHQVLIRETGKFTCSPERLSSQRWSTAGPSSLNQGASYHRYGAY
jgi:hypothetical protein